MKNRQVVLTRNTIAGVVGAVSSALLLIFGVHVSDDTQGKIIAGALIVLPLVLPLLSGLWARIHVTPVFDPRDADGTPLIPLEPEVSPRQDITDPLLASDNPGIAAALAADKEA